MADVFENTERKNIHEPIEGPADDCLGRQALAQTIWERLLSTSCPQSIGVYGGWGSGKTSLLNLIARINDADNYLQLEMINAWEYENTGNLLTPVLVRLEKMALGDEFRQHITRIWKVTSMGFVELLLHKTANVGLEDVKKYIELSKTAVDEIKEAKKDFEKLVKRVLLVKNKKRLVFCIDNLDRCRPENVVGLLESIKNFLSVPDCVWLFAIDSGVVASYITYQYDGTTMDGYSFLDKIIPEQYHLSLSPSEDRDIIFNLIYSATGNHLTLENPHRLPQIPRVIVPRRLIKSAQKFFEFFNRNSLDVCHDTVFVLILLYHSWPDFYELLSSLFADHVGRILANFFRGQRKCGAVMNQFLLKKSSQIISN